MGALYVIGSIIIIGASVGWAMLRGLSKARIRGISLIVCAVLAVLLTAMTRGAIITDTIMEDWVLPLLEEAGAGEIVTELLGVSPTLDMVLLNLSVSLVTPIVCVVYFFIFSFLTWIVFLVLTIVFREKMKEHNQNAKLRLLRSAAWGLGQGLVIAFICTLPFSVYLGLASPIVDGVMNSQLLGKDEQETFRYDVIQPIDSLDGALGAYRAFGGDAVGHMLTDFEINGNKIELDDELGAITSFGCNIVSLGKVKMEEYNDEQARVFEEVAASFNQSQLLPTIAGEVLYNATDKWLENGTFMGAAKPTFGEMGEIFSPFFTTLLEVMHTDAKNPEALQADLHTVADMVSVLASHGVFSKMSNTDALMTALSSEGVVEALITTMGQNSSMKILIPEVTNMGLRAVATTLGIPGDVSVVYGDFLTEVAGAVNYAKGLEGQARDEQLTADLKTAFDTAGIPVDTEIIQCYAVSMSKDLIDNAEKDRLAPEDIKAFFAVYAMSVAAGEPAEQEGDPTEGIAFTEIVALDATEDLFAGTVYAGKNQEDLLASGAAVLARAYTALVHLDYTEDYAAQATNILTEAYSELLQNDESSLATIGSVVLTKTVTQDALDATGSLQSADEMITQKITLDKLLIDTKAAAEKITEDTLASESKAISSIFETASDLKRELDHSSEMKLEDVATSFGTILDSLNEAGSVGQDKTANLFTAVMQSDTVRQAADLDMATATKMAQKATEGESVNYTQTMSAVSGSVTVLTKMGKDGERVAEEDLIDLVRNINPQTAGMIEVYATPERIESYQVSPKYSATSSELICSIFHHMANESMGEEQYAKEAKALNQILNIALSAKEHSNEKHLFTKDGQTGILPGNATESVETFMSSGAVCEGMRKTMLDENGNVKEGKFDAFDIGAKIPETSTDRQDCEAAIAAYYAQHHDESTRQSLLAFAALLGVDASAILV